MKIERQRPNLNKGLNEWKNVFLFSAHCLSKILCSVIGSVRKNDVQQSFQPGPFLVSFFYVFLYFEKCAYMNSQTVA